MRQGADASLVALDGRAHWVLPELLTRHLGVRIKAHEDALTNAPSKERSWLKYSHLDWSCTVDGPDVDQMSSRGHPESISTGRLTDRRDAGRHVGVVGAPVTDRHTQHIVTTPTRTRHPDISIGQEAARHLSGTLI